MACYESGTTIGLTAGEAVTIADVRGATLRVRRGVLWVTQERVQEDVILRAGDTWTVERDGATVLEAQEDARVYVVGRQLAPPPRPRRIAADWSERLVRIFPLTPRRALPYA